MSNNKSTTLSLTAGTALVAAFAAAPLHADVNPFAISLLTSGYMVADAKVDEAKCGANKSVVEAKCGAEKAAAKAAEAKCGADKKVVAKPIVEAKCGEAKCGSNKK